MYLITLKCNFICKTYSGIEMLQAIKIENYKSIKYAQVDVGRFNVLVGENGAGKSNFLEVLASASAIIANNFSNEFMLSRGIRIVDSKDIFSCFNEENAESIEIYTLDSSQYVCSMLISFNKNEPFSPLQSDIKIFHRTLGEDSNSNFEFLDINEFEKDFMKNKIKELANEKYGSVDLLLADLKNTLSKVDNNKLNKTDEDINKIVNYLTTIGSIQRGVLDKYHNSEKGKDSNFIIFSPELSSLRSFSSESQIEPLGVNGEGLLKLLQVMQEHEQEQFEKICKTLEMFQWVEKVIVEKDESNIEQRIKIVDRFMGREIDHRSANEGFLFVLFYVTLFSSKFTPESFAVDNIDASLNPKLCRVLIKVLIELAKENDKQAFVTTHNPAILDGLDLHDDDQRLFVVERKDEGDTALRRIGIEDLPKPTRSGQTIKLSEAFMRGLLGGLPTNF